MNKGIFVPALDELFIDAFEEIAIDEIFIAVYYARSNVFDGICFVFIQRYNEHFIGVYN